MNRSLLQIVFRHTDGLSADADTHLLRRYVASRDESAFTALVKRHGPMVWAVCRQSVPNHADAEDAFQATFLALAQSAKRIRTPERLAGWLHAAAVRIAAKAKRSFSRRLKHEQTTARPESDSPVSAATWGDLQAAVHAEVSGLPPSLRAVFVLCDLEGVDHAEAARRLGLKTGTLSGQLARARQRLLAALSKRGIAAGAVVFGAAISVPDVLANKVTGGAVPSAAVLTLAAEVTTMGLSKLKLLAAGLLVAGGLTLTGLGLLTKADGQPPPSGVGGAPPGGAPVPGGPLGVGGPGALPAGTGAPPGGGAGGGIPGGSPDGGEGGGQPGSGVTPMAPTAFEYLFVAKPGGLAEVAKVLTEKATRGWEYAGPLDVDPTDPKGVPAKRNWQSEGITKETRVVLVFKRRPAGGGGMGGGGTRLGIEGSGPGGGLGGMGMPGGGYGGGGLGEGGGGTRGGVAPTPGTGSGPGATTEGGASKPSPGGNNPLSKPRSGGGTLDPFGSEEGAKPADEAKPTVFHLKHANASQLADTISNVYARTGIRVVPDTSSNTLVIVAPKDAAWKDVTELIRILDDAAEKSKVAPPKK